MKKTFRKAFKFRLNTSTEQSQKMTEFAGANRFVWNKILALNLDRLNNKQPLIWYHEADFWVKIWKRSDEFGFLKNVPSQALQQKLKDLNQAFKDGFDKTQPLKRIPVFKKKGLSDSFRYPQGFKVEQANNRVFLPKIGWVKYRNSRAIIGEAKNITVTRQGKHWYISVQTKIEVEINRHESNSSVGVDMGVKRFYTLSDENYQDPLNSFRQLEKKLAFEQRKLSKKVKFSSNWKKQKQKITRCHEHIANSRLDFLQKQSTELSQNHAMIIVEDLKVKNMSKSSKGTIENPGKNIKQKSGLNKSILDQGWGMFVSMLKYKQQWAGGDVLKVPAHYTSQTCPEESCGHISKANRKTQSEFECVKCGYKNHADVVGAMNVLARGLRVLACGVESLDLTTKQEPVVCSDT